MEPDKLNSTEVSAPPLNNFSAKKDRIPERFGPYIILDKIAESMGVVYKARQTNPERTVALKLPIGGKLITREDLKAFEQEIAVAAQLDHSAIVPVLETGIISGTPYYTMPFIEGRDLFSEVQVEALDWPARLDLFRKVCRAVQSLHDNHLIHRDLKPHNILVDRHGDVRLLDFGLAKAVAPTMLPEGKSVVAGTLQFMAPEQTRGKDHVLTPACDVYALGMIFYWMACNALPYSVPQEPREALELIKRVQIKPPQKTETSLAPAEYDEVICSCLQKDPTHRPRDARNLLSTLSRVEKNSTRATEEIKPTSTGTPATADTVAVAGGPRGRLSIWLVLLGGATLLGAGLFALLGDGPAKPAESGDTRPTIIQQIIAVITPNPNKGGDVRPTPEPLPDPVVPVSLSFEWRIHDLSRSSQGAIRDQVIKPLQQEFKYRDHGAVLFTAEQSGRLTIQGARTEDRMEMPLNRNQVLALTMPANRPYTWEWRSVRGPQQDRVEAPLQSLHRITLN